MGPDQGSLLFDRYGYRPLPGKIPQVEMNALLDQMLAADQDLVRRIYELDLNCLDENNCPTPEYVLAGNEKRKTDTKAAFAALQGAAEKKYGDLHELPRLYGLYHVCLIVSVT